MGYIKLDRRILSWQWFKNINVAHLWIYILERANYEDQLWNGITVSRGSFITSINKLSEDTGLSVSEVRTCINKLISTNEITKKSTKEFTIISVVKYDEYQSNESSYDTDNDKGLQHTASTTNKKIYIKENNKEEYVKPSLKDISDYICLKKYDVNPNYFYQYCEDNEWKTKSGNTITDWKGYIDLWSRKKIEAKPSNDIKTDNYLNLNLNEFKL